MKDNQFKIDTQKRNIIIAVIVAVLIIAGIITGVVLYNMNNKPTEESATETTEVEKLTEDPTEDETKTVKDTEEPASTKESEDTEDAENTEKTVNSTEEVRRTSEATQEVIPTEEPATQAHTHTWSEATCTSPKTCTTCGATEGSALGHDFSVDKPEDVYNPDKVIVGCKCSDCGEVFAGDDIIAHQDSTNHRGWDMVEINDGWEVVHYFFCSRCGAAQ